MAERQKDDSLATATTLLFATLRALSNTAIPLFTANIALASQYGMTSRIDNKFSLDNLFPLSRLRGRQLGWLQTARQLYKLSKS